MTTKHSPLLTGVFPVFSTPFHEDESLDFSTLEKEIHYLFDAGADGIVAAMVSEILRLDVAERQELATMACALPRRATNRRLSVWGRNQRTWRYNWPNRPRRPGLLQ